MTTIEWLQEKLNPDLKTMQGYIIFDLLEEAKEMHKQEIINAYKADTYPCSDEDAEEYYNETFKNQ